MSMHPHDPILDLWEVAELEVDHTFGVRARPALRTWSTRGKPCGQVVGLEQSQPNRGLGWYSFFLTVVQKALRNTFMVLSKSPGLCTSGSVECILLFTGCTQGHGVCWLFLPLYQKGRMPPILSFLLVLLLVFS